MWQKIALNRLEIGQYIKLDYPWFAHPFPRSTFRLTSQDEIDLILKHNLKKISHDPARWERDDADDATAAPGADAEAAAAAEDPPPSAEAPSPAAPVSPAAPELPATLAAPTTLASPTVLASPTLPASPATLAAIAAITAGPQLARKRELRDWGHAQTQGLRNKSSEVLADAAALTSATERLAEGDAGALSVVDGISDKLLRQAAVPDAHPIFGGSAFSAVRAPAGELARSTSMVLAALVSSRLQFSTDEQRDVMLAAALHMIGAARFSASDRAEVSRRAVLRSPYRAYPLISAEMARRVKGFSPGAAMVIQQHRELVDGSGFPAQLKGDAIRPGALLVGLIHEYQLLTAATRPTGALSPASALALLYRRRRAAFGARLMDGFVAALTIYPPGTVVELSDGEHAVVVNCSNRNRLTPVVMVVEPGSSVEDMEVIDLAATTDIRIARTLGANEISPLVRTVLLAGGKYGLAIDVGAAAE